ncbi:serine C-palmitoyltransferase LCB1 Ecym_4792 [Eremothecium cymbalariae DBVPG|uniref:serine C-palmitoyltransferase n=1 Tax=Eremothecium cymbalariae (strain CBS 270.75 / DBVPG 7215 / KCTC 17166 / NRRL Y-17582) TaxID=931890 RepID=G8JST1_ERECY|nr:hypothetical protein Ecym_4792 [Eremothecium cymbalariae DBVPG\
MKSLERVPDVLPSSIPIPSSVITVTSYLWFYMQRGFMNIPGAQYVVDYVAKSHQDDPYRTMIEIALIIYGIIYYLNKPRKQGEQIQPPLSLKEEELLIAEWQPEELVVQDERQNWRLGKVPVLAQEDDLGLYFTVERENGGEKYTGVLNMASNDFLHLSRKPEVVEVVEQTIRNYGVGSCGPAGFYGNQDVHYNLEYKLARFFGTENAVLYGQDFCVASSVVPAFTKRGDVIVADDQVSVSMQNALQLSRSTVYYFKHNDMKSLEDLLEELDQRERADCLPAIPRKFIVTEGLFHSSGDLAPLPQLVELKVRYRYRLIVDETNSIGVLGATGRGLAEHFKMERDNSIDITIGSLAYSLGSSGGFALGDNIMSQHQRIGSNAYCFSASLPPYTCAAALKVLKSMDEDNSAVRALHAVTKPLHTFFSNDRELRKFVVVTSNEHSAVLHLQLTMALRARLFGSTNKSVFDELSQLHARSLTNKYVEAWEQEELFLQSIVDRALQSKVLITRNAIALKHEALPIVPNLKICVNASISREQLLSACKIIKSAVLECCIAATTIAL